MKSAKVQRYILSISELFLHILKTDLRFCCYIVVLNISLDCQNANTAMISIVHGAGVHRAGLGPFTFKI